MAACNRAAVPPAIVIRPPINATVSPGQVVRITCVAYGIPTPTFTWSTPSGVNLQTLSGASIQISSTQQLVDGTQFVISVLQLCAVDSSMTDQYICISSNGLTGNSIGDNHAAIFLNVAYLNSGELLGTTNYCLIAILKTK